MKRKTTVMENTGGDLDLSVEALKGRQSVRATFRLPEQVIQLLSIAAHQLGVKQKSLFDQLVESEEVLDQLADEGREQEERRGDRVQKTYVLSRSSLLALETVARQTRVPRDVLVELSIERLRPLISAEQKRHRRRKALLAEVEGLLRHGREVLVRGSSMVKEDDPLYAMLESWMAQLEQDYPKMIALIEKGEQMEDLQGYY